MNSSNDMRPSASMSTKFLTNSAAMRRFESSLIVRPEIHEHASSIDDAGVAQAGVAQAEEVFVEQGSDAA